MRGPRAPRLARQAAGCHPRGAGRVSPLVGRRAARFGPARTPLATGVGRRLHGRGAGRHRGGARPRRCTRETRSSTLPSSTWRPPYSTMRARSSGSASSPGSATARSGARATRSLMPAPISPACRHGRYTTATATSSPARRCGRAGPARPTGACSSPVPIRPRRGTRASAAWSSTCTRPGSRFVRSSRLGDRRTSTRCSSTR